MTGRSKHLFGQLAPFVDALLERFSFPNRFELLVDRREAPCGMGKSLAADFSLVKNAPYPVGRAQRRQSHGRAMGAENEWQQVFRLSHAIDKARRDMAGKALGRHL